VEAVLWNSLGDIGEILDSMYPARQENCWDYSEPDAMMRLLLNGHCSVLVKAITTDGQPDVALSHSTWSDYRTMLRIMKTYKFPLSLTEYRARFASSDYKSELDEENGVFTVIFSAYPGLLSSFDDFYVIVDRGLVVTETTNDICNKTLFSLIKPDTLMCWERTMVADMLATDGKSWTDIFVKFNSGTYNNQFIIMDTRLFKPSSTVESESQQQKQLPYADFPANFLWIVEQMPGKCTAADVTPVLNLQGYWPSYNRPYFPDIFEAMGYKKTVEKFGDFFSYDHAPRANIFRRDQGAVKDLATFKKIMLFNNWQNDPLSLGSPWNSIVGRGDLVPDGPKPPYPFLRKAASGGTDSKIATARNVQLGKGCAVFAISGPTHDQQSPFAWKTFPNHSRVGMPDQFNFGWQTFVV